MVIFQWKMNVTGDCREVKFLFYQSELTVSLSNLPFFIFVQRIQWNLAIRGNILASLSFCHTDEPRNFGITQFLEYIYRK